MSSYWRARAEQRIYERMEDAEKASKEISKFYADATQYLQKKTRGVFEKYAVKYGLSRADARTLLNELDNVAEVKPILDKLEALGKGDELRAVLESPAYKSRIDRYVDLQNQIDDIMQNIYQQEKNYSELFYLRFTKDCYYKTLFDISQRAGIMTAFGYVSDKMIERLLGSKWYGENYSERIWGNLQETARVLKEKLFVSFVTGKTEFEVSQEISERMGTSYMQSRRLIRTESAMLSGAMDTEAMKDAEVEKYIFLATLDLRTSDVCRKLDGKIGIVSKAKTGDMENPLNPMHPWCRSTTMPIINEKYISRMKRKFKDPNTLKRMDVPLDMTYEQWWDKFVKGTEAQGRDKVWHDKT